MKDALTPCAYAKAELVLVTLNYFRECKLAVMWPKLEIYTSFLFWFGLLRHGFSMLSWLSWNLYVDQTSFKLTEILLLLPLESWN